ncbi:MAG: Gfo/Idh/MocA family oxidoreductase [Burkholderiales bacterium]|nr:Gfo/Idh/MocA family oxidoreductase [Burkholderiales bacterium]
MKRIRIGIIGLGWVSTHRHIPSLLRNPRFEIVAVADRNADLAVRWAKKLRVRHWSAASSILEIDWLSEVDAVDVATAPMSHYPLIKGALLAGKHVITEKPFAMSLEQGEELVSLAKIKNLRLAIVHNFQFASSTQRLIKDIDRGRLGTVRSIVAFQWGNPLRRLPTWYEQLPSGLFFDESPHLLYLVRRLSPGPLRLVHVDSCPSTLGLRTPASVDASFRATVGEVDIPVTVNCRFEAPLSEWHVAVLGDKATGVVDVFRDIYLKLPNDGSHGAFMVARTSWHATVMHWARHIVNGPLHLVGRLLYGNEIVFSRFAQAIDGGYDANDISGDDALEVLKMQVAIANLVEQRCGEGEEHKWD